MKFIFDTNIVGKEVRISKKTNNAYGVICFMDGVTPVTAMIDSSVDFDSINLMQDATLHLDAQFGKYTKLTVMAVVQ